MFRPFAALITDLVAFGSVDDVFHGAVHFVSLSFQ